MSLRHAIVLSLLVIILAACSEAVPTVGEAKEFNTACDQTLENPLVELMGKNQEVGSKP